MLPSNIPTRHVHTVAGVWPPATQWLILTLRRWYASRHRKGPSMFVRAKEAFETPSHNVIKGALVDLPEDQALRAIEDGLAVEVGTERAIDTLAGVETAEDTSAKVGKKHANDNAEQQVASESRRGQTPSWAKR